MGRLYFVRHGQTVWNVENKICGRTDSPLTDRGKVQARELGNLLLHRQVAIDKILSSPLSRARDTAAEIAVVLNKPVEIEQRLIEQNFGKWEGQPRDSAAFLMEKRNFAQDYEGGESMLRLCQRIYSLLDELKEKSMQETCLLVAHNGIARAVESYFCSMTNEEYAAFGIQNCEIRTYQF